MNGNGSHGQNPSRGFSTVALCFTQQPNLTRDKKVVPNTHLKIFLASLAKKPNPLLHKSK